MKNEVYEAPKAVVVDFENDYVVAFTPSKTQGGDALSSSDF